MLELDDCLPGLSRPAEEMIGYFDDLTHDQALLCRYEPPGGPSPQYMVREKISWSPKMHVCLMRAVLAASHDGNTRICDQPWHATQAEHQLRTALKMTSCSSINADKRLQTGECK
jgi:hypothetical protein